MNYIRLNIGGEERGCKLGLGFIQKVLESEKITISDFFSKIESESFTFLPKLLFYSLAYNEERSGNKPSFELNDVLDWIDEIGLNSDAFTDFQIAFFNSIKVHLPEENQNVIDTAVKELQGKKKPSKKGK